MLSFNFLRWLQLWLRPRAKTFEKKGHFRLCVEHLEDRLAPASVWIGGGGAAPNNTWSNAANWQFGNVPTVGAPVDLIFDTTNPNAYNITNDDIGPVNGVNLTVNSITFSANPSTGPYTLQSTVGDSLTLGNGTYPSATGNILVNNGAANETISINMQLGDGGKTNETINVGAAGASLTLSGLLSGNSATTLGKQGNGQLTLTGNNSAFLGPIDITSNGGEVIATTNANALGAPVTSDVQTFSFTNATPGVTQFTLTYPNGTTNPSFLFPYTGNPIVDVTAIQTALNNAPMLGVIGTTSTVTELASGAGSATFAIDFAGTGNVLQLSPAVTVAGSLTPTKTTATLAAGGQPNYTTVSAGTDLQVNIGGGAVIPNPLNLSGTGFDNFSGALQMNSAVAGAKETISGNIVLASDVTIGENTNSTLTLTGVISDPFSAAPGFDLTEEDGGNLVLDPQSAQGNTYHGNTFINNGFLTFTNPFSFGAGGETTYVNTNTPHLLEQGHVEMQFSGADAAFIPNQYLVYAQEQTVSLTNPVAGTTEFTLTFNGVTTPEIAYTNNLLTNETAVATQLNALATIGGIGGNVNVTEIGTTFFITFTLSLGGLGAVRYDSLGNASFIGGLPELSGAIVSAFGSGTISEGTTTPAPIPANAIGFAVPDQYLSLGTAGVPGGPAPFYNVLGDNSWDQPTANTAALAIDLNKQNDTFNLGLGTNLTINGQSATARSPPPSSRWPPMAAASSCQIPIR